MQGTDMPTSWKRADDNALRAHLQEALAERMTRGRAEDWSYSDYEVAAIQEELRERQLAIFASRHDLALERPALLRNLALSGHAKRREPMPARRAGHALDSAQQVKHAERH
jgi:hypothetical protein